MFERVLVLLVVVAVTLMAGHAHAAGTPAGTTITNRATANYSVSGTPAAAVSSSVTITVDELISVARHAAGESHRRQLA